MSEVKDVSEPEVIHGPKFSKRFDSPYLVPIFGDLAERQRYHDEQIVKRNAVRPKEQREFYSE
ncbi:MAG: hypothetical protein ACREBU_18665 [Nitrososphaera sp.]